VAEITAAIIGATASVVIMSLSNISNRRERDTRELFRRLNELEKLVASHHPPDRNRKWRA
jgi:hypothetical protein